MVTRHFVNAFDITFRKIFAISRFPQTNWIWMTTRYNEADMQAYDNVDPYIFHDNFDWKYTFNQLTIDRHQLMQSFAHFAKSDTKYIAKIQNLLSFTQDTESANYFADLVCANKLDNE